MKPDPSPSLSNALKNAAVSFAATFPLLLGVILLVGAAQSLVSQEMLASLFGHGALIDTVVGTLVGAVASGNPSIGYVVGGELLGQGVSLFAVSAFILAWVTLGFIGLPAEIGYFGLRFTLVRNILSLVFTVLLSMATVLTLRIFS